MDLDWQGPKEDLEDGTTANDPEEPEEDPEEKPKAGEMYKCPKYLYESRDQRYFICHFRNVHDGYKPYACRQCGARFASNGLRNKHVLLYHTRH